MDFLSPKALAIAASLSIPPLVALYFLKLKRNVQVVPSTLLWKKAVEDLRVNAPFQRLRNSLLLWLQLLILAAAALALGKPMFRSVETHKDTLILLIDQSASMSVVEADGKTRLDQAKAQAKAFVDNMAQGARSMIIAFCDRATVVSTFNTDKQALKRHIDGIEQTDSSSALTEAINLAEAYMQNIIIGMEGQEDIEMMSDAAPATVAIFSDGRIEDGDRVVLQNFDVASMRVISIGERSDNVGIIAMDARRDFEHPEILQVSASVTNHGAEAVTFDAVLYVDGNNVDVQAVLLGPADHTPAGESSEDSRKVPSTRAVVFDAIEFDGAGTIEIRLRVEDALAGDNRAFSHIERPRDLSALLVTPWNPFLTYVLDVLEIPFEEMTPEAYETAENDQLAEGERSRFDVVIIDGHSTARLHNGNYFFWGGAPLVEGVEVGNDIRNQVIFNWDDTHPVLRYTAVENLYIDRWKSLRVPDRAEVLIKGESTPILAYFSDPGRRFLVAAFSLIVESDTGQPLENSNLQKLTNFIPFMQNAIQYLAGSVTLGEQRSIRPGEPVTMPVPPDTERVRIERPDRRRDVRPTAGADSLLYSDTRAVGEYRLDPGIDGREVFTVNLFNPTESRVEPAEELVIGGKPTAAQAGTIEVNEPAWPYLLAAMLVILVLEWIVYNRRVMV